MLSRDRLWAAEQAAALKSKRPKVAAVFTEFRFRSHAYNILENFLAPYLFSGKLTDPGVDVVSALKADPRAYSPYIHLAGKQPLRDYPPYNAAGGACGARQ